jgi:hypothetical protein
MPYAACDHCCKLYAVDRQVPAEAGDCPVLCPACAGRMRPAELREAVRYLERPERPDAPPARARESRCKCSTPVP